ncbi:MAG: ATP-binding cassette domain-containing protein [Deltaproteobacteria bacterium]|nr:ATP-binding cassette domain-containing protein [Deltaproteobacteria bacterium]
MIKVKELKKSYGEVEALKGVSFEIHAGELFAYLGPNGAGKTTTIRILTGLTKPSAGDAWLDGFHIEKEGLKAKRRFGLVMQSINLDQELSVWENLDLHGRLFGMGRMERKDRINELLAYVDLIGRKRSLVKELSGGMKRRLTIARALVHAPAILFLDEPTVGLDAAIRRRIWALIKKIQGQGTTIFLTTHYIEEAEFLADRVAFLDKGRIVTIDKPQSLMARIGAWAIDQMDDGDIKTVYFKSRQEADAFVRRQKGSFTVRRVNLEDSFLSLTGKKVQC